MKERRPRLALPYTVLAGGDAVRLVAGEDFRYTLTGPGLERWLPGLLARCDGRRTAPELIAELSEDVRDTARQIIDRLHGERVLIDGTAAEAHTPAKYRLAVEGTGPLAEVLASGGRQRPVVEGPEVKIFCQDRLDYAAALEFNRRCLKGRSPWLWATTGPMGRGYVSPPFLPGAGPCLGCLLRHFQRLSPAPEIYAALIDHGRRDGAIAPAPFPAEGITVLHQLVLWKLQQLEKPDPPSSLYRLHVLELDSMEVTTHRVYVDPECPECVSGE